MRARMALQYAGIQVEHREIELRNKPQSMLLASPKGTVPVLCVEGQVIDQSLDIMHWALEKSDPDKWSDADSSTRMGRFNHGQHFCLLSNKRRA